MGLEDASSELAANFKALRVPSNSTVNFVEPELEIELKKKKKKAGPIIDVKKEVDDNMIEYQQEVKSNEVESQLQF